MFGEVRPGELVTAALLTANIFLLLAAYYLLKVAREHYVANFEGEYEKPASATEDAPIEICDDRTAIEYLLSWAACGSCGERGWSALGIETAYPVGTAEIANA